MSESNTLEALDSTQGEQPKRFALMLETFGRQDRFPPELLAQITNLGRQGVRVAAIRQQLGLSRDDMRDAIKTARACVSEQISEMAQAFGFRVDDGDENDPAPE